MGKGKKRGGKVARLPKKKCCVTTPQCSRCPILMLKEGNLPDGYTVHKRELVKAKKLVRAKSAKHGVTAA